MAKAGKSSQISKDLPVEQSCLLPSLYMSIWTQLKLNGLALLFSKAAQDRK